MHRHHILLLVAVQIILAVQVFGATVIPQMDITGPTTWPKSGNPYTVTGLVTVDSGATLTIEAGVDIQFDSPLAGILSGIEIERGGFVFADGLLGDTIYFRGNGEVRNGFITNYGCFRLRFCRVENMNGGNAFGGTIKCRGTDSSLIDHCMFYNNTTPSDRGGAIEIVMGVNPLRESHVTIINSYFNKNHLGFNGGGGAISLSAGSYVDISDCTFDSNYTMAPGRGGAIAFGTSHGIGGGLIKNNLFINNSSYEGGAIYFDYAIDIPLRFTGNLLYHNSARRGGAIGYEFAGVFNSTFMENNTIVENSADTAGAIRLTWGIEIQAKNNIIWNNYAPVDPQVSGSFLNIPSFSCIEGYSNPAKSVIDSDPLFASPLTHNYHLTVNSPCINAGDTLSPLDPDFTRADMGAFYYRLSNGSGDANNDCRISGVDVVYLVRCFRGSTDAPPIKWKTDADGNCLSDGMDITFLINYFKGKNLGPLKNTSCEWTPPPPPDPCSW